MHTLLIGTIIKTKNARISKQIEMTPGHIRQNWLKPNDYPVFSNSVALLRVNINTIAQSHKYCLTLPIVHHIIGHMWIKKFTITFRSYLFQTTRWKLLVIPQIHCKCSKKHFWHIHVLYLQFNAIWIQTSKSQDEQQTKSVLQDTYIYIYIYTWYIRCTMYMCMIKCTFWPLVK